MTVIDEYHTINYTMGQQGAPDAKPGERAQLPSCMRVKGAADYSTTSPKTVYAAIKDRKLRAARIGAGRNLVTSRQWVDEWLTKCAR